MKYLSPKFLLCALLVAVMALFAVPAFAESEQVGSFEAVSSTIAASIAEDVTALDESMISSAWWEGSSVSDDYKDAFTEKSEAVVITIPYLNMVSTGDSEESGRFMAAVSYDFSVISGSVYAASDPLKFYPYFDSPDTEGEAVFYDAEGEVMTASTINSVINSDSKIMGGYIIMTLSTDALYYPVVTVALTSADFMITPSSADMQLIPASSDMITLTVNRQAAWSIVDSEDWTPYESSYVESTYKVTASLTSTDARTARLTLTAPASADNGQNGYFEICARDLSTDECAYATVYFTVSPQLTITLSRKLVSVDLNGRATVSVTASGASGDVSYELSEELWTSLEENIYFSNRWNINIAPTLNLLEGKIASIDVTARDSRGISGDKRGIATDTLKVYVYGPLSVDVSSTSFTISSADNPEITFTTSNASGDVSFDVSVDWASVKDGKFVVGSLDASLAGTTQTVTVTAKDDRGRAENSRGETSVTLNIAVNSDAAAPFTVSVLPDDITVIRDGSASATLTPSNAAGEVSYSSSASWLSISGNTITVNYSSAYAGTTQTATITATDSGRTVNNTATTTLSASFEAIIPIYSLTLTPRTSTRSVNAGATDRVNLSLNGANGTGVTWSHAYDNQPSGNTSSNPLGIAFSQQSSSSAVLTVNPDRSAVPGTYTVHIYTRTTTGRSTGGDGTITITLTPAAAIAISPESITRDDVSVSDDFTLEFTASNVQGTPSWSITGASWSDGENPLGLSPLSLSDLTTETITINGNPKRSGPYSFTVSVAGQDGREASAHVAITVTGSNTVINERPGSRVDKAQNITITPVEITPEMEANIRTALGLSASTDIHSLTSDNLLSPVSPDADTELAMNQRGFQLAANLSRIRVSTGGLYAFQFSMPSEYVNLNLNDLTVFSQLMESNAFNVSSITGAAYGEDGLASGDLLGTDGTKIAAPARDMLAVVELEPDSLSATFFGSKVIPARGLDELAITTVEITDTIRSNLAKSLSADVASRVRSISEENIHAPVEPSQSTIDAIREEDNFELAYKLNSIQVDEEGYYAFSINIPSELLNTNASDVKVYVINQNAVAGSSVKSSIITGVLNVIELDAFGLKLDSLGEKILAVGLLNAGTPLSVYLGKLILMLLMGGCQVSFSGMGMIALAGSVLILGGARLLKRR